MRAEIEELRMAQRQNERIFAALVSKDKSAVVLEHLHDGESVEAIVDMLDQIDRASTTHTTFRQPSDQQEIVGALRLARSIESSPRSTLAYSDAPSSAAIGSRRLEGSSNKTWDSRRESSDYEASGDDVSASRSRWSSDGPLGGISYPLIGRQEAAARAWSPRLGSEGPLQQGQDIILGAQEKTFTTHRWTTVSANEHFVDHVMALYFCWEYPTFASLNKEYFLEDYRSGTTRYCSSLLVNSILALGCRFSNQPEARLDPNNGNTAGDHFFKEALRLLELEHDRHSLTTIQALGLMSLREASCGRSSESLYLSGQSIRLAIEIGLHKVSQDGSGKRAEIDQEVRSATFWGAFSLDQ